MSIIGLLSSTNGRRDKEHNKKLASEIASSKNTEAIIELVENLNNKDKNIQSDCIEALYETGYIRPELIANYHTDFLKLLESKNNRLLWGGMIALTTIADLKHHALFESLDQIMIAVDKGSVITIDCGVIILARLSKYPDSFPTTNPLLMEQLLKCPIKQLPMYAERSLECISDKNRDGFKAILENRITECEKESQLSRIHKVLKKLTSSPA